MYCTMRGSSAQNLALVLLRFSGRLSTTWAMWSAMRTSKQV